MVFHLAAQADVRVSLRLAGARRRDQRDRQRCSCSRGPACRWRPQGRLRRPAGAPSTARPTRPISRSRSRIRSAVSPYGVAKKVVVITSMPTGAHGLEFTPWPGPTCTGRARTPTARPAWSHLPGRALAGERAPIFGDGERPGTSSTSTTSWTPSAWAAERVAAGSIITYRHRCRDFGTTGCTRPWPWLTGVATVPPVRLPRPGRAAAARVLDPAGRHSTRPGSRDVIEEGRAGGYADQPELGSLEPRVSETGPATGRASRSRRRPRNSRATPGSPHE